MKINRPNGPYLVPKITVKIVTDPAKNSLSFSRNFRIFSTAEPIQSITGLTDLVEDLTLENPAGVDLSYLTRYFRYSRNRLDWSLWYEVSPTDVGEAATLILDNTDCFYFELKYEYDDGSNSEMNGKISVNEVKLRFNSQAKVPTTYSPVTICSDESCTSIIVNRDPSFRPYDVDSAIGMYKELSFFTNQIWGHQVVYFRTLPESDSGDYIFKEWTLYKNIDRKCIKVVVPKNSFPSNAPRYNDTGLDFLMPFEVHIDHRYFQSIFGKDSEPRHRDFLFFPLINRMFEIQGSYLHRGFMMSPTFWKIQLKKYNRNIDMLLTDSSRTFLDNVVLSSEQLFGDQVAKDVKDAVNPAQFQTISTTFDRSRQAIHPDLILRPIKSTYNYNTLMENYYDLSTVVAEDVEYVLTTGPASSSEDMIYSLSKNLDPLILRSNYVVLAYEDSEIFAKWRAGDLKTGDRNIVNSSTVFCRVRGPFDPIEDHVGESALGRYVRVEAYRDLSFSDQKDVLTLVTGSTRSITMREKKSAVIYTASPVFNTTNKKNLSFTCLFNLKASTTSFSLLEGYDPESDTGIRIDGVFSKYSSSELGDLTMTVTMNDQVKTYSVTNITSGSWHAFVFSASNEFKQCGLYIYSLSPDPSDSSNTSGIELVFTQADTITELEFELIQKYVLPSSDIWVSNLRIFNTMIREEQHEFILSQRFIRDESMLEMIDNCRQQLNIPYIAKNK